MKNKIPQFLQENLSNKNARPKYFSTPMKNFIYDYGCYYDYPNIKDLDGDKLISLWFRFMKSNISTIGYCEFDDCLERKTITKLQGKNTFKVSDGCCWNHTNKISLKKKYNVNNVFQLEEVKNKSKKSLKKRYGVDNPSKSDCIKKKKKETLLKNYNVSHNMKSEIVRDKRILTWIKNYGVTNPMKNPIIFQKALNSSFKRKEFIWKTGEISLVQGFEPIVLKELEEEGYIFNEVMTSPKDMPKISYQFEKSTHVYYPDIFIPKDNIVIEVKSEYTLQADLDKNKAKFEATKALGFDFRLEVR